MRMLALPQTDLRVSQICLGSAEFGLKTDEQQSFRLLDRLGESGLPAHLRRHFLNDANRAALRRLKALSAEIGASVAALSLAYLASQPRFVGVPIIFTSQLEHLIESLAAGDLRLTPRQVAFLEGREQSHA